MTYLTTERSQDRTVRIPIRRIEHVPAPEGAFERLDADPPFTVDPVNAARQLVLHEKLVRQAAEARSQRR